MDALQDYTNLLSATEVARKQARAAKNKLVLVGVAGGLLLATFILAAALLGHWLAQPELDQSGLAAHSEQAAFEQLAEEASKQ